jgi:hypothetical protein
MVPQTVDDVHVDTLRMRGPKIFGDASDETGRKLAIVGLMERYGRLMHNVDVSYANKWRIRFALPQGRPYPREGGFNFANDPQWKEAVIGVRGFVVDQSVTYMDYVENGAGKNDGQTIGLLSDRSEALVAAARHHFNHDFKIDGNAAANADLFHGIESCLAAGTVAAADRVALPDDTYAGLDTDLAAYGGSGQWSADMSVKPNATAATDWPFGSGPVSYDFNSPLLVNTTSTTWASGTSFVDNAEEVLRFMFDAQNNRCQLDKEMTPAPLFGLLGADMLREAKEYFSSKQVILQEWKEARDFGLAATLEFEGNMLTSDFHIGSTSGYCINPAAIEFFTHMPKLWDVEGPTWKFEIQKFLFLLRSLGNYRLRPRHLGKWYPYA